MQSELKDLLRKTPRYFNYFSRLSENSNYSLDQISKLYKDIRNYKQLFPDILDRFNTFQELEEYVYDKIELSKKKNKVKKFISNKYEHLIDNDTIELFSQIPNLDHHTTNEYFVKKIAKFKTSTEFNVFLTKTIKSFKTWNKPFILKKINKLNIDITYDNESILILRINDIQSLQKIGCPIWCILKEEEYHRHLCKYKDYTLSTQYMIYDFSRLKTDPKSIIGVTVKYDDLIKYVFYRNNTKGDESDVKDYKSYLTSAINPTDYKILSDTMTLKESIDNNCFDMMDYHYDHKLINTKEFNLISLESLKSGHALMFHHLKDKGYMDLSLFDTNPSDYKNRSPLEYYLSYWIIGDSERNSNYFSDLYCEISERQRNHAFKDVILYQNEDFFKSIWNNPSTNQTLKNDWDLNFKSNNLCEREMTITYWINNMNDLTDDTVIRQFKRLKKWEKDCYLNPRQKLLYKDYCKYLKKKYYWKYLFNRL